MSFGIFDTMSTNPSNCETVYGPEDTLVENADHNPMEGHLLHFVSVVDDVKC
jgi:hypothetical protein